ncbi:MAG: peptidylprolyl isomerase [candidate division Zixibacteria bacterium]|nr:peptidylprolyl isomerase [candidate division Zixibacteria bacterium]MCI0596737.1 peptidylprolyl isomerase [candidate division Zixibacteria bacterium]
MRGLWYRWGLGATLVLWLWPWILSAAPKPTDVVAEVDGFRITMADVQKKLSGLGPVRPKAKPEDLKREAVNELITEHLVKIKARSIPVENDSAFMRRADHLLSQLATREIFNREVISIVSVSDSEVTERYRLKPENYQLKPWARASHILIAPVKDTLLLTARQKETGWWADSDSRAKPIADSLYRMIAAGASFDSLARHWSQDMVSGVKGGDLGRFSPGQMVPEFDSVVLRQEVGVVSRPVKTRFGYHLIKVTFRQEQETAPLNDSLRQEIKQQLQNEKTIQRSFVFLDSLLEAAGVVFNESVLEMSDSALQAEKVWAAASPLGDTIWSDRFGSQLVMARPVAPRAVDRDFKLDLLKQSITPFLLRRAVNDMKITESEAFLARKEQIFQNEKMDRLLKEAVMEYHPSPDEIQEYFQTHKASLLVAESLSVHVQQMVFKTQAEAGRASRELEAGADFSLLARKYFKGDSDIAQEAFDLGFISPPAMPSDFFAVAETLTIGAASRPVRTPWGYHLMRVLARRPDLSLEMARPKIVIAIRQAKQEEHKRKWEENLREGHAISIKERVLKSIKVEPSATGVSSRP